MRKFTILGLIAIVLFIVAVVVYSFNFIFGQEIRPTNGTRILFLQPINSPDENIKKYFMKEYEGILKRLGLEN